MKPEITLFPPPQSLQFLPGFCKSPDNIHRDLTPDYHLSPDAYFLAIREDGITLRAASASGLFYALQTLTQIQLQHPVNLPCLEIEDFPVFPVRGLYHDVTRGKVPTLATLMQIAEQCASLKINQLQLYIEHTFAYKNHPEVWAGADPLTADDILKLDARCAELHIDLVPSFSSFGHFYTFIHNKFPELNELERDVSQEPFCWWNRQMHYTLDCQNPASLELIREIITETRPLFRSRFYNICCDETFDLGKGRNKALAESSGPGRLYIDFLKQLISIVQDVDAVPMFWGDIVKHHPELLDEVSRDTILLDWDYSADIIHNNAEELQKTGRKYFLCPGVQGWNDFLPRYKNAHANILNLARHGVKHGACGYLITDWGDAGHINFWGPTIPMLALGGAAAWNPASPLLAAEIFNPAISKFTWGDPSGRIQDILDTAMDAKKATWQMLTWCHQPRAFDFPDIWFDEASGFPNGMFKHSVDEHMAARSAFDNALQQLPPILASSNPSDPLLKAEVLTGFIGMKLLEEIHIIYALIAGRVDDVPFSPASTADALRTFIADFENLWMQRNRRSEVSQILEVLRAAESTVRSLPV